MVAIDWAMVVGDDDGWPVITQWQHTVTRQKTNRVAVPAAASKHSTAIGWGSLTTAVATSIDSFHRSIL